MAWLILIVVLLAAAFGVLGAVLKLTAILLLTILLTLAALAAVVWYGFQAQIRRWDRDGASGHAHVRSWSWGRGPDRPRDLPSHDDRY
jgi:peptidoglycan/LPS O-acetylase OafA/YrhL